MSRKNVRLLASGFLFSGLLILIFSFSGAAETSASDQDRVEALEAEIRYLEEVAVSLELENEQLAAENTLLAQANEAENDSEVETDSTTDAETETQETNIDESDEDESDEADSEDDSEEENDEEPESETAVAEYVVVVNEGEPSSVVAAQLESFGLIDDYHGFNRYMEENNLFRQLRPGEFTVHSDMTREQLIAAIIR